MDYRCLGSMVSKTGAEYFNARKKFMEAIVFKNFPSDEFLPMIGTLGEDRYCLEWDDYNFTDKYLLFEDAYEILETKGYIEPSDFKELEFIL